MMSLIKLICQTEKLIFKVIVCNEHLWLQTERLWSKQSSLPAVKKFEDHMGVSDIANCFDPISPSILDYNILE